MARLFKFHFLHVTPNINVESSQVLFPKPKKFANNTYLGGQRFFHLKRDFLFCPKSCFQDCRLLVFL